MAIMILKTSSKVKDNCLIFNSINKATKNAIEFINYYINYKLYNLENITEERNIIRDLKNEGIYNLLSYIGIIKKKENVIKRPEYDSGKLNTNFYLQQILENTNKILNK